ncbi:MAG TPA: fluoride efflux transporter CrcB [Myxococcales bacterium]|nr:fluoride efflux transporter CrcB [Myxococcales bacterium]
MIDRLRPIFLVALGGAFGAVARYGVATAFARRIGTEWPWGTLFINLTGSFLIAVLAARLSSDNLRFLLPVGFVGAYTTFSTYEYETLRMMQDGEPVPALLYVAMSNLLGFAAVFLGDRVAR